MSEAAMNELRTVRVTITHEGDLFHAYNHEIGLYLAAESMEILERDVPKVVEYLDGPPTERKLLWDVALT